jgi:hypothetical protein
MIFTTHLPLQVIKCLPRNVYPQFVLVERICDAHFDVWQKENYSMHFTLEQTPLAIFGLRDAGPFPQEDGHFVSLTSQRFL